MWTVISSVLTVFALLCSVVAIFLNARSVVRVEELRQRFHGLKPYAKDSLEARLTELEEALQVVANRVKMSRVRTTALHATEKGSRGEPDFRSDPEAWRAWQNRQLKTGVVN
jgi:hypothetical protein